MMNKTVDNNICKDNRSLCDIILNQFSIDVFNSDSIKYFIKEISIANQSQSFFNLEETELLMSISAIAFDKLDNSYHPTLVGLIMFGDIKEIKQVLPTYNLYYGEIDKDNKFINILSTDNEDWSCNVYDFYRFITSLLTKGFSTPQPIEGLRRKEESPIMGSLKEVFLNTILNVDFLSDEGVRIERNLVSDTIRLSNTGKQKDIQEYYQSFKEIKEKNKGIYKIFYLMGEGKMIKLGFDYLEKKLKSFNCDISFIPATNYYPASCVLINYSSYEFLKHNSSITSNNKLIPLKDKTHLTANEKVVLAFIRDDNSISIDEISLNCNKTVYLVSQIVLSLIKKKEIEDSEIEGRRWDLL